MCQERSYLSQLVNLSLLLNDNKSGKPLTNQAICNRGRSGMKNVSILLIYKDLPVAFGYLFMISTEFDHDILF